ncbi:MAG TPA: DUF1343 domain-containing protein [Acidobacteriota bacterium]|nr:DUF1343 domain-containing protein [Acidobacteriota bacterium]
MKKSSQTLSTNRQIAFYLFISAVFLLNFVSCEKTEPNSSQVKPGIEVFLEKHIDLVKGKRVGLVTNPTGVDTYLKTAIELLFQHPDINLTALYGPEHGVRGNAQAGEYVPFYMDEIYHLPVFSLYGQTMKPDDSMISHIDEYMRSFDTQNKEKAPNKQMVSKLDVMIFDIQDVGTRIYTYVATMAFCMQACAENNIEFIVLDRPNPINGIDLEGPVLKYPEFSSFVGLYPIPVRHGMTIGELALLFNDSFFEKKVTLKVIPMKSWKRDMWYDETLMPWVIPSPNMPTLNTAMVYPGQVYLEGTNISEGRGTTKPFELFGAPWIEANHLTQILNSLNLPGVRFREAWFKPVMSKYKGKLCGGSQIHITDRDLFKPFECTLWIVKTIREEYPEHFRFHEEYFDKIMGTDQIRQALIKGTSIKKITDSYQKELVSFKRKREKYLLYSP